MDVVETNQPSETAATVSYPSQTPSTIGALSCDSNVEQKDWIKGVTIISVSSTSRQVGAEYLLLDSGAQLHARPIKYPGQKVPLPDPGNHTASGARLQHDGGRLVTYKLSEGRAIRVLFHACAVQKLILSLGCLAQQGTGVIFVQALVHCLFPDKIQTKHSQTQSNTVAQGRELVLSQSECWLTPLSTAGCE